MEVFKNIEKRKNTESIADKNQKRTLWIRWTWFYFHFLFYFILVTLSTNTRSVGNVMLPDPRKKSSSRVALFHRNRSSWNPIRNIAQSWKARTANIRSSKRASLVYLLTRSTEIVASAKWRYSPVVLVVVVVVVAVERLLDKPTIRAQDIKSVLDQLEDQPDREASRIVFGKESLEDSVGSEYSVE